MESVPDMDSLLDEIEDTVEKSVPIQRPKISEKIVLHVPKAIAHLDTMPVDLMVSDVADDDGKISDFLKHSENPPANEEFNNNSRTGREPVPNGDVDVVQDESPTPQQMERPYTPPDAIPYVPDGPQLQSEADNDVQSVLAEAKEAKDETTSGVIDSILPGDQAQQENILKEDVNPDEDMPDDVLQYLNDFCDNDPSEKEEETEGTVDDEAGPLEEPETSAGEPSEDIHRIAQTVANSIVENCLSGLGVVEPNNSFYSDAPEVEKVKRDVLEEPREEESVEFRLIEKPAEVSQAPTHHEAVVPEAAESSVDVNPVETALECEEEPIVVSVPINPEAIEIRCHDESLVEAPRCDVPEVASDALEEAEDSTLVEGGAEGQPIATVHDLEQESGAGRLTESELMLGKQKPYWIPDSDCEACMLCSVKFSLMVRRHHCRACGRVLCSNCCNKKATLEYMKNEAVGKKPVQTRVCSPCFTMLERIEAYEQSHSESVSEEPSSSSGTRVRGVLKSRSEAPEDSQEATSSSAETSKRSVTFRDGVKPGSSSGVAAEVEKSTTIKPKKKTRKRLSVVRKITEMKLEDELASILPTTSTEPFLIREADGSLVFHNCEWTTEKLKADATLTVILRKNLSCVIRASDVNSTPVWSVFSDGFATVGLEEVLFVWKREDEEFTLPTSVLERISQVFYNALNNDSTGVHQVASRFPRLHSTAVAIPPLPKHILFYRPTTQDFGAISVPSNPFLVACFLCDSELSWVMACPNRLLFRLGLKYGSYPHPFVNIPGREAVFSSETNYTVLKVFTDFRNWSYRMSCVTGCTVALTNDTTILRIPMSAQPEICSIVEWNRSMIAWSCELNLASDSHLVCEDSDGVYTTHVLAKGASRETTGASFVIIDGGLKSHSQLQVSVVEDGVAIRLQPEQFRLLCESLCGKELNNFSVADSNGSSLSIEWVDGENNASIHTVRSLIDGKYLEDKYQYGLSMERALTAVLEVASAPGVGVRLSHVYNLNEGRLSPEDEPKVFSIVEMLARECSGLLGPSLPNLLQLGINCVSLRFLANRDCVEYDVSQWIGLEEENGKYRESMDKLIPVLYNVLDYLSSGIHVEFTLSFVSTASLPVLE